LLSHYIQQPENGNEHQTGSFNFNLASKLSWFLSLKFLLIKALIKTSHAVQRKRGDDLWGVLVADDKQRPTSLHNNPQQRLNELPKFNKLPAATNFVIIPAL